MSFKIENGLRLLRMREEKIKQDNEKFVKESIQDNLTHIENEIMLRKFARFVPDPTFSCKYVENEIFKNQEILDTVLNTLVEQGYDYSITFESYTVNTKEVPNPDYNKINIFSLEDRTIQVPDLKLLKVLTVWVKDHKPEGI